MLKSGHYIDISTSSSEYKKVQYWDYHFHSEESKASKQEYIEELDRLFKQSVQRQLVSDVELGLI